MPFLLLLIFFLLSPDPAAAYNLKGRVRVLPPLPAPEPVAVNADQAGECGSVITAPALRISAEGFVQDAVVYLEEDFPPPSEPPAVPAVLDQKNCVFSPHVVLVLPGSAVEIRNSDGFLHNVRAFDSKAVMLFNEAMPRQNQILKKIFSEPGRFTVRCGIHRWMYAIVVVPKHRYYAVTDGGGRFALKDVPAGNFTLAVWHERLGELRRPVDGQTGEIDLIFPSK
ncbi:MAG: hypothetical protein HY714_04185 [Candidatus Omnitrophica bacterium]|nr:hypothetical protein [Candidatus Omnitrophota bacterium]